MLKIEALWFDHSAPLLARADEVIDQIREWPLSTGCQPLLRVK
jgi:hypothetical protein